MIEHIHVQHLTPRIKFSKLSVSYLIPAKQLLLWLFCVAKSKDFCVSRCEAQSLVIQNFQSDEEISVIRRMGTQIASDILSTAANGIISAQNMAVISGTPGIGIGVKKGPLQRTHFAFVALDF